MLSLLCATYANRNQPQGIHNTMTTRSVFKLFHDSNRHKRNITGWPSRHILEKRQALPKSSETFQEVLSEVKALSPVDHHRKVTIAPEANVVIIRPNDSTVRPTIEREKSFGPNSPTDSELAAIAHVRKYNDPVALKPKPATVKKSPRK